MSARKEKKITRGLACKLIATFNFFLKKQRLERYFRNPKGSLHLSKQVQIPATRRSAEAELEKDRESATRHIILKIYRWQLIMIFFFWMRPHPQHTHHSHQTAITHYEIYSNNKITMTLFHTATATSETYSNGVVLASKCTHGCGHLHCRGRGDDESRANRGIGCRRRRTCDRIGGAEEHPGVVPQRAAGEV